MNFVIFKIVQLQPWWTLIFTKKINFNLTLLCIPSLCPNFFKELNGPHRMLFHCCIATQTQNSNSRSLAWPSRSHITSTELQQNKQKRRKAATATKLDPAQRSHPHHRIPVAKRRGLALGWPNRRCVCERRPLFFSWHSNLHSYMCNGEGFGGFREHFAPCPELWWHPLRGARFGEVDVSLNCSFVLFFKLFSDH